MITLKRQQLCLFSRHAMHRKKITCPLSVKQNLKIECLERIVVLPSIKIIFAIQIPPCQKTFYITGKKNLQKDRSSTNNSCSGQKKTRYWSNCPIYMKRLFPGSTASNVRTAVRIIHRGLRHLISNVSANTWSWKKVISLKSICGWMTTATLLWNLLLVHFLAPIIIAASMISGHPIAIAFPTPMKTWSSKGRRWH